MPSTRLTAGNSHYYVYKFVRGEFLFDRTVGTERRAEERILEYRVLGFSAVWTRSLIPGAFY